MDTSVQPDPFGARATLARRRSCRSRTTASTRPACADLDRVPFTVKVLLENVLRHAGGGIVTEDDVRTLAAWRPGGAGEAEVPFMPARVILQDFTGVPAVVDLAAMRDAVVDLGGDPARINPLVPADLVIDHSVQVDRYGTAGCVRVQRRAGSTSATASATSCCAGHRPRSRTCASCRPARASSTRSTWSTSPRW